MKKTNFTSDVDFLNYIDRQAQLEQQDMLRHLPPIITPQDSENFKERARTTIIKKHLSKTHKWVRASSNIAGVNFRKDMFWCEDCHIYCSTFEHVSTLSIINKVSDGLPSRLTHDHTYLMYACEVVRDHVSTDSRCIDCGLPKKLITDSCQLM